jgi:hypothetical protein
MKILVVCSTSFYDRIQPIQEALEKRGFLLKMPNCYDEPITSDDHKKMSEEEYLDFFKRMYYESREAVSMVDAILVLNYNKIKDGVEYHNYIGASTFLEMYEAFMQNKKIYIFNDYPDNMLYDEIKGFHPIVLKGNLDLIQ